MTSARRRIRAFARPLALCAGACWLAACGSADDLSDAALSDTALSDVALDASPDASPDASLDARPLDATSDAHPLDAARDDASTAMDAALPPIADIDAVPWTVLGTGVSYKDTGNLRGENVFIGYAGYQIDDDASRAWASALYRAWLGARGVRYVYAVRGPMQVTYDAREIQNTHLIATLLPTVSDRTRFIAVAAHSSGAYVACELFQQLFEMGFDPAGRTRDRVVYYDLDGAYGCLDATVVAALRRPWFVSAHSDSAGWSLNAMYMMIGAMMLGGPFRAYDASASGCAAGASLCLHGTLINTRPHDPTTSSMVDYADFAGRPVNTWYLDVSAADLPAP